MDKSCRESCDGRPRFDSGVSSTFTGSNTTIAFTYYGDRATGSLAADSVSLAGYQVQAQTFGAISEAEFADVPGKVVSSWLRHHAEL